MPTRRQCRYFVGAGIGVKGRGQVHEEDVLALEEAGSPGEEHVRASCIRPGEQHPFVKS